MKKIIVFLFAVFSIFGFVSCDKNDSSGNNDVNDSTNDNTNNNDNNDNNNENTDPVTPPAPEADAETTIYLAGDSTVKTYEDNQYIAGWGQYLDLFLKDNVTVINCAQGGRSSRSFINEGRLFDIEGCNYSFTQNDGKSIGSVIEAGDYLFIQFGHNDDSSKKQSSYSTMFDRMVDLGTADSNGIYPTTAGTKKPTTHLPQEYINNVSSTSSALNEIAKYGSEYYSYDCGGTYKWFLKQYIDFARSKKAIPVLVTPVARVKFSGSEIIGGPGLHGENFAYVEAVRQLAKEEDCLLIDLFAETKSLLEVTTSTYSDFLMALKPNDLVGTWPGGFDAAYQNTKLGYTGIEATHYNKYGAYLTAACVAENMIASINAKETHNSNKEAFKFKNSVLTTPQEYIDPSNKIAKAKVSEIEGSINTVKVTNPNRTTMSPTVVVNLIEELAKITVTNDNYLEVKATCEEIRIEYLKINVDDIAQVTNISKLEEYEQTVEEFIIANRPVPTRVVALDASSLSGTISSSTACGEFTIVGTADKAITVQGKSANFTINGTQYSVDAYLSMGGSASFGTSRYISFTTTGKCSVTVVAKSSGTTDRAVGLVNSTAPKTNIATFDAKASLSVTTAEISDAGTYYIGSTGSGLYIYYVLIEYFD